MVFSSGSATSEDSISETIQCQGERGMSCEEKPQPGALGALFLSHWPRHRRVHFGDCVYFVRDRMRRYVRRLVEEYVVVGRSRDLGVGLSLENPLLTSARIRSGQQDSMVMPPYLVNRQKPPMFCQLIFDFDDDDDDMFANKHSIVAAPIMHRRVFECFLQLRDGVS
jgi:hypothetical protein